MSMEIIVGDSSTCVKLTNMLCVCNRTSSTAVCSGSGEPLEYLPRLPSYIENVHLHSFRFKNITNETFASLASLGHLSVLNIANSTIDNMSENAFYVLKYFPDVLLNISHNVVAERVLTRSFVGLQSAQLEYLDLRHLNIIGKDGHFFDILNGTRIKQICVSKNYLTKYDHSKFANVIDITRLILSGNDIEQVHLVPSPYLRVLKLAYNCIKSFIPICYKNESRFPNLEELTLDHNNIKQVSTKHLRCLTRLKILNLSRNKLFTFKTNSFAMLPNLENLTLRNMAGQISSIEPYAFNNSNLKSLYLEDNRIDLQHDMDNRSLKGLDNLIYLDISNNIIYKPRQMDVYMNALLGHLKRIQVIVMSNMFIFEVPKVISNFSQLRALKLYSNHITEIPKHFLYNFPHLTDLVMGRNAISVLYEDDFPEKIRQQLKRVDVSQNPFICDCQLLWFVLWMRRDPSKFTGYNYICFNTNKNITTNWKLSVQSCLLDKETAMTVIVVVILLIVILAIASLCYRWRWYITHYIYMTRFDRSMRSRQNQNIEFSFDAFISYCKSDEDWVCNEAIPNFEGNGELKLCIHERDFLPGKLIADNIEDSLQASRKIILVLSNAYALKEWCLYELDLCQRHVLNKGHDFLIVVMLETPNPRLLTSSLQALLKTTTYIPWPVGDADSREMFWNRLRTQIRS